MKKLIEYIQLNAAQGAVNVGALAIAMALVAYAASSSSLLKQAEPVIATEVQPMNDGIQTTDATATFDPLLGQVNIFPYNFAPRGWIACEGQLLPVSQNSALFSLIGTIYGGDGRTTFGVPDLRGRMVIGRNLGPGLTNRTLGHKLGSETTTLTTAEMPSHTHTMTMHASTEDGEDTDPTGRYLGAAQDDLYYSATDAQMNPAVAQMANQGSGTFFNRMPPVQVLGFYIATQGIYPSRN